MGNSGTLVDKVTEFIDDDYVAAAGATEYLPVDEDYNAHEDDYYDEDEEYLGYKEPPYLNRKEFETGVGESQHEYSHSPLNIPDFLRKKKAETVSESLEDALKKIYTESFEKYLQQLINKKGLKKLRGLRNFKYIKAVFFKAFKGKGKAFKRESTGTCSRT